MPDVHPQWVVVCRDVEQGEDFVIGPFETSGDGAAWAATDSQEKAQNTGGCKIDTSECGRFVSLVDDFEEVLYEWEVEQLISPVGPGGAPGGHATKGEQPCS